MKSIARLLCLLSFAIIANVECKHFNNVCKTFLDYYTRIINPNCWYNPDVTANAAAQILSHGYPLEIYEVITEDYYILQVFRIPQKSKGSSKGIVVFLPPATVTSTVWTELGNESLAFLFSDAGYDVWMGNFRGNIYADKHVYLSTSSNKYWNYSFHEIGLYDYPAIFDLVRRETGSKEKLYYISHSMTSTAAFVYASLRPQHAAQNIKLFICWAPPVYLKYTTSLTFIPSPLANLGMFFAELFHMMNALPHDSIQNKIKVFLCSKVAWIIPLCAFYADYTSGFNPKYIIPARSPLFVIQNNAGLSIKVLVHYAQIYNTHENRFQLYDYGTKRNQYYYHSRKPPLYPIEDMKVPMCLVYGGKDNVADKRDVVNFYNDMPKEAKYSLEEIPEYNHLKFFTGKDLVKILYNSTINTVAQFRDPQP